MKMDLIDNVDGLVKGGVEYGNFFYANGHMFPLMVKRKVGLETKLIIENS